MTAPRIFWWLVLTGMGLRLLWALWIPVQPVSDSAAYHQFARTLVDHGVYGWDAETPSAYWAVGTSALAALTYLFTDGFAGVVVLNLLTGLAIMLLVYTLTARWFGPDAGLWGLALVAFWPTLILFTTILSSELLFIAMTLAGLFFWQRPRGNPMANLLLAGLVWGLAAYIRPVILLVPLALALADLRRGPAPFLRSTLEAGIAILLILLISLPWTIRNQRVMGDNTMISTNFGPNLWMGNNSDSNGGYMALPAEVQDMSEAERNSYLKEQAKTFMAENPGHALALFGQKLIRLNIRETIGVAWNETALNARIGDSGVMIAKLVTTGYWYLMLSGGLAGLVILTRRNGIVAALFNSPTALWGYFTALHAVVVADDRYHIPSIPFVASLAALTCLSLFGPLSREGRRSTSPLHSERPAL